MTDKQKIISIADSLGDKVIDKPHSFMILEWRRRFKNNDKGEILKVQDIIKDKNGKYIYV